MDWSLVTQEALESLDVEGLLSTSTEREAMAYSTVLAPLLADETRWQTAQFACLGFLQGMLQMGLKHANAHEPYGPMFVFGDQRSWIPADLPKDMLLRIYPWAEKVADAELRARALDVIWMQGRHFPAAQGAVRAYVAASKFLSAAGDWPERAARLERALRLAASLGKGGISLKDEVLAEIQGEVDRPDEGTPLRHRLIDLLLEFNHGDAAMLGSHAAAIGTAASSLGKFFHAKDAHTLAAECFAKAGDSVSCAREQRSAAEALASEAEAAYLRPGQGAIAAASIMGDAVTAMRQAGGDAARAGQMHERMLEWQTQSLAQLQTVTTRMDVTDMTRQAIESVRGKSFRDAVLTLCSLVGPPTLDSLKNKVHKDAQVAILGAMTPLSVMNYRGRTVAIIPPLDAGAPDVSNEGLRGRMFHEARSRREPNVRAILYPALRAICEEHRPTRHDIAELIRYSAAIPRGHGESFLRALLTGFDGDMLLAAHLVPPKFEAMLRHVMEGMGADTSILGPTGLQPERIFKPLLELEEAKTAFGEDAVFEMQDVFVDTLGGNLRNEALHGLMPDETMFGPEVFYAWWLLLRYCVLTTPSAQKSRSQAPPTAPEAPTAAPSDKPDEGEDDAPSPAPDKA
ncbi:DUF4209 domain-containing protein [Roseateles sp. NT4]|uniref:DUF4209 domain-containing protein n=1 Tax=Roseateles sp. NT4 TaxID=3453715 RepID=UPI003EEA7B1C